jgi:hypothetical protein
MTFEELINAAQKIHNQIGENTRKLQSNKISPEEATTFRAEKTLELVPLLIQIEHQRALRSQGNKQLTRRDLITLFSCDFKNQTPELSEAVLSTPFQKMFETLKEMGLSPSIEKSETCDMPAITFNPKSPIKNPGT